MDNVTDNRPIIRQDEAVARAAIHQDGPTPLNTGNTVMAPQPFGLPARTGPNGFTAMDLAAGLLAALIIWCPLLAGALHSGG